MKTWRMKMRFIVSSATRTQLKIKSARQQMNQTRKCFENFQKNVKTFEKIVSKQNQRIVELKKKFEKKNELIVQFETQMTINQRFFSWFEQQLIFFKHWWDDFKTSKKRRSRATRKMKRKMKMRKWKMHRWLNHRTINEREHLSFSLMKRRWRRRVNEQKRFQNRLILRKQVHSKQSVSILNSFQKRKNCNLTNEFDVNLMQK